MAAFEQEGQSLSLRQLELRCQLLDVDKRNAELRCEEYRKLLFAYLGESTTTTERQTGEFRFAAAAPAHVRQSDNVNLSVLSVPLPPDPEITPIVRRSSLLLPPPPPPPNHLPSSSQGGSTSGGGGGGGGLGRRTTGTGAVSAVSEPLLIDDAGPSRNALDNAESRVDPSNVQASSHGSGGERRSRGHGKKRGSLIRPSGVRSRVFRSRAAATHWPQNGSLGSSSSSTAVDTTTTTTTSLASPQAPRGAGASGSRRFCNRASTELFLREQGLGASSLTPQDTALADATPSVPPKRFTALFGGSPQHERPLFKRRPGAAAGAGVGANVLCINPEAQPYAPSSPGEPGLLLIAPNVIPFGDQCETLYIFFNVSQPRTPLVDRRYRYLGTYTKVPVIRTTTLEVDEWLCLPLLCRAGWTWRIISATTPDKRAVHARVCIRNSRPHGPPPSPEEINEWLESNPRRYRGLTEPVLMAAFDSGEEKIGLEVVKCVGYDVQVARRLQRTLA